jgi:hypothetical protein
VGIDLGTSNSALAFCKLGETLIETLDIDQVQRVGEIFATKTLASVMYLPHEKELKEEEVRLPWEQEGNTDAIVGHWALTRGSLSPDRLVLSAKSWLINRFTDPREEILPWGSEHTKKVSALQALTAYLKHLREALLHRLKSESVTLNMCQCVLTIPASFDEVARQLVVEAADKAGLLNVSLLEEPQAAFYAFLAKDKSWQKQVQAGDLVLVCDVGGGTSDFSLIAIHDKEGELALERIAVGEHLLLGGDNMDMALAYLLQEDFLQKGVELDTWQFHSLVHEARRAKEELLGRKDLKESSISVTKRGNKLVANTISTTLTRERVESVILDGFFPMSAIDEALEAKTLGLQEWGLPYESDAAISKHLAAFLKRACETVKASPHLRHFVKQTEEQTHLRPNLLLFNGGVFEAVSLRERVLSLLKSWNTEEVRTLDNSELDLAVAQGAAYFASVKSSGKGVRIKAGTSSSYYIGVKASQLAVPGVKNTIRGLCIVPQGTEEGTQLTSNKTQFGLLTGETVPFRFFHSKQRGEDGVGTLVHNAEAVLEESRCLSVALPAREGERDLVPVTLEASVSDVGTLHLYMKHTKSEQKWQLEFDLRKSELAS